jgi:hypothetical protein
MLVGLQFRVQYRSNVCLACDLYAARAPVNVLILFFLRVSLNLSCATAFCCCWYGKHYRQTHKVLLLYYYYCFTEEAGLLYRYAVAAAVFH